MLCASLDAASAASGWNYMVVQKNDPSRQGLPSHPAIFFEKLFDDKRGFPVVADLYDQTRDLYTEVETQVVETTFQISALVIQDPKNLSIPTASDVVNYLSQYLQSRVTINNWMSQGAAMLRITKVTNPIIIDDMDRFEAAPTFDVVIVHNKIISAEVPAAASVVGAPSPIPGDNTHGAFPIPSATG